MATNTISLFWLAEFSFLTFLFLGDYNVHVCETPVNLVLLLFWKLWATFFFFFASKSIYYYSSVSTHIFFWGHINWRLVILVIYWSHVFLCFPRSLLRMTSCQHYLPIAHRVSIMESLNSYEIEDIKGLLLSRSSTICNIYIQRV
jgi:hypothetical protein